ncbi:male-enhanced antigen 1 [Galleria mellonella]|uniref:Male-enhanced antigen 1 n=1 Tax=Galleria mellonella TaxID=7137 RepID=A0A6J1WFP0_GALME|nr:male-enhanced antigen 1 [Galleria mellonella]
MVCEGPDPPDNSPHDITPPPRHDLMMNGIHEDSDDEQNEYFGYEPLPQGPDTMHSDHESDEETENNEERLSVNNYVPPIESMDTTLTREVWNTPHPEDSIQMDNERAQQVMSAMANFALPQTSIPDWAKSITEEQWKQTLNDRIEILKSNR